MENETTLSLAAKATLGVVSAYAVYELAIAVDTLVWCRSRLEKAFPGIDWSSISQWQAALVHEHLEEQDWEDALMDFVVCPVFPGVQCLIEKEVYTVEKVYSTCMVSGPTEMLRRMDEHYGHRMSASFKERMLEHAVVTGRFGVVKHLVATSRNNASADVMNLARALGHFRIVEYLSSLHEDDVD